MPLWHKILLLIVGGSLGTLARYGLAGVTYRLLGQRFAWGTLIVNLLGCFVVGLAWSLSFDRGVLTERGRLFVMVGFLGAFTTFSTYMLESINMLRQGDVWLAWMNVMVSTIFGMALVVAGFALGRAI